ncbi:MAG: Xaa-Pro dipeptidase [Pseudomonadota bacterium]|nr:Xaa-Pro dipeptidase [Pseudomonadota bacterium]
MSHKPLSVLHAEHIATLKQRTERALEIAGFDALAVPSGSLHYQLFDDRDYPYAVNPQFKHWAPLTRSPGSWLLYTPGHKPKLIYLQPQDYWHATPADPAGYWVDQFDIVVVRTADEALAQLPAKSDGIAILGEAGSAQGAFIPNNPADVLAYLDYHRAFKTPYEIEMIRRASRIGVRAHRAAERAFRAGASEFGIHLAYCQAAGQDANDLPYNNIVALNEHAAVLHYTDRERLPPKPLRSFLIDAGASHAGYACDITRTYSAAHDDEFQALIDAVDAAQRRMCDEVRAGTDYRQLHVDAHHKLGAVLKAFGIIHVDADVAVETGITSAFFPHGIGHGIGLQVHDVAGFAESERGGSIAKPEGHPYLRLTRTLQPGMAVTIEPGLYFIDMLLDELRNENLGPAINWDRVEAFKPFGGIRIEDEVVCTDAAPLNLTRDAFEEEPA